MVVLITARPKNPFNVRNNICGGGLLNHNAPGFSDLSKDKKSPKPFCNCLGGKSRPDAFYQVKNFGLATIVNGPTDDKCGDCDHYVFWSNEFQSVKDIKLSKAVREHLKAYDDGKLKINEKGRWNNTL